MSTRPVTSPVATGAAPGGPNRLAAVIRPQTGKPTMSARPSPVATDASPGGPNRLAAVLAAGLKLNEHRAPCCDTGVIFTRPPGVDTCPICFEPLFGCASAPDPDGDGGDYTSEEHPCRVRDVQMRKDPDTGADIPVVALRCSHQFHLPCIAGVLAAGQQRCPTCRVKWSEEENDDITVAAATYNSRRELLLDQETRESDPSGHFAIVFKGMGARRRKVRAEHIDGRKVFYEGEKGAERKVRSQYQNGKVFFEGEKGAERKVREEYPGIKWFYEGEKGAERRVRIEKTYGKKAFYEGEKGAERLVRTEDRNGVQEFFENDYLVRIEFPNGVQEFFEGTGWEQLMVRKEFPDGRKEFYEGKKGAERKEEYVFLSEPFPPNPIPNLMHCGILRKWNRFDVNRYFESVQRGETGKGTEWVVRVEFPNGELEFYEGGKGAERKVRVEFPDGSKQFYQGKKGAERVVRTENAEDDTSGKRQRIAALAARGFACP